MPLWNPSKRRNAPIARGAGEMISPAGFLGQSPKRGPGQSPGLSRQPGLCRHRMLPFGAPVRREMAAHLAMSMNQISPRSQLRRPS